MLNRIENCLFSSLLFSWEKADLGYTHNSSRKIVAGNTDQTEGFKYVWGWGFGSLCLVGMSLWVFNTALCLLISVLFPNFGLWLAPAVRYMENLAWQPQGGFGVLNCTELVKYFVIWFPREKSVCQSVCCFIVGQRRKSKNSTGNGLLSILLGDGSLVRIHGRFGHM